MTKILSIIAVLLMSSIAFAADAPGKIAFADIKQCVMRNDVAYCRGMLTENSWPLFDRFTGYKLMPCLPTDFTYVGEEPSGDRTIVKATMPASNVKTYYLKLVFRPVAGTLKLDVPETFRLDMGEKWQNKVQLSEQIYLMMKQNLGDKLNCDMLNNLLQPDK